MKAIVRGRYGSPDVLEFADVAVPPVGDGDLLVRVHSASLNAADLDYRSLGADHVIDYTRDDFTRTGDRYDRILDVVGRHSITDCRRALTRDACTSWPVAQLLACCRP